MENDENEIHFEDTDEDVDITPDSLIKKLREKLKKCETDKREYLAHWQRDKADFVNARKDDEKKRQESSRFAAESIMRDLLPVLDSFDLAFSHKEAWEATPPNWRAGVMHIHTQLSQILESYGLAILDPQGKKFDPEQHISSALESVDDEKQNGIICRVLQRGYTLGGKIIRPARVTVGEYKNRE